MALIKRRPDELYRASACRHTAKLTSTSLRLPRRHLQVLRARDYCVLTKSQP